MALKFEENVIKINAGLEYKIFRMFTLRAGFSQPLEADLNKSKFIKIDNDNGQTSLEWLFAGGDASTGPASVVSAIAAGEKAAIGINCYLTGKEEAFWREEPISLKHAVKE